jgi:hypothetical protein
MDGIRYQPTVIKYILMPMPDPDIDATYEALK